MMVPRIPTENGALPSHYSSEMGSMAVRTVKTTAAPVLDADASLCVRWSLEKLLDLMCVFVLLLKRMIIVVFL